MRTVFSIQREFMDRASLAKNLATLLPATARAATIASLDSFKRASFFKAEMEKPALYASRARLFQLLPKERKPDSNTNWNFYKNFMLKALATPKTPGQYTRGRGRGRARGRGQAFGRNNRQIGQFQPRGGFFGRGRSAWPNRRPRDAGEPQGYRRYEDPRRLEAVREKRCFYCHQKGHLARNCEKAKAANTQKDKK